METDKTRNGQDTRERAVELAISEIAAYKDSTLGINYTEKLLLSAKAISDFLAEGKLPVV
jgi:hypothetical protein